MAFERENEWQRAQRKTSFDLLLLDCQILRALEGLKDQKLGPRREQIARQQKEGSSSRLAEQERCSSDNDKDDHHPDGSVQFRLVFISNKLRRVCNRYHRKSMPETRSVHQSRVTSD